MTKFYVVRHGETDYNKKRVFQGRRDIPLNATGEKQAQEIANKLKDIDFEAIYHSPLIRAKQTAEEVYKFHPKTALIEAPEITERDFGGYEGVQSDGSVGLRSGMWDPSREAESVNGSESVEQMRKRVFPFLDSLLKKYPNANICLVCHGGTSRVIYEYFMGKPAEGKSLLDFPRLPNGEAAIFEK